MGLNFKILIGDGGGGEFDCIVPCDQWDEILAQLDERKFTSQ